MMHRVKNGWCVHQRRNCKVSPHWPHLPETAFHMLINALMKATYIENQWSLKSRLTISKPIETDAHKQNATLSMYKEIQPSQWRQYQRCHPSVYSLPKDRIQGKSDKQGIRTRAINGLQWVFKVFDSQDLIVRWSISQKWWP